VQIGVKEIFEEFLAAGARGRFAGGAEGEFVQFAETEPAFLNVATEAESKLA